MADDDNFSSSNLIPKLIICLIAAASAAVVVAVYHCFTTGHIQTIFRRRRNLPTPPHRTLIFIPDEQDQIVQQSSIENSLTELIPSHKYQKGAETLHDDGNMCAVCLCEFEEGEELRTLPECMHSYHAPCIDMWLFSHSNCPICRTNAAPSPHILIHSLESNLETPPPPSSPLPLQEEPANLHNVSSSIV